MDGWMNGRMDACMNACMHACMDKWMDAWMDGWMDGWIDGWMDGWVDGWMDGWMDTCNRKSCLLSRGTLALARGPRSNHKGFITILAKKIEKLTKNNDFFTFRPYPGSTKENLTWGIRF